MRTNNGENHFVLLIIEVKYENYGLDFAIINVELYGSKIAV